MFKKRHCRLTRLAEEIEERRSGDGGRARSEHSPTPRRVSDNAFFSRIAEMRAKGGAGEISKA
jgi:hypothetical protein